MKKILLFTLSAFVSILPPFFAANPLPLEEGNSRLSIGQNSVSYNQAAGRLNIDSTAVTANIDLEAIRLLIDNNPDEAALLLFGGSAALVTYYLAPEESRKQAVGVVVASLLVAYGIKKLMNDSRQNVEQRAPVRITA